MRYSGLNTFNLERVVIRNQPLGGNEMPRFGGNAGMMRLPRTSCCRAGLVEVSAPYDPFGNTALVAANLLYEMLCITALSMESEKL